MNGNTFSVWVKQYSGRCLGGGHPYVLSTLYYAIGHRNS